MTILLGVLKLIKSINEKMRKRTDANFRKKGNNSNKELKDSNNMKSDVEN